jgi:Protein of unknown function (DUF1553)
LQLFDFPSPNLSAEKRFTTTVPLQRLFFMNSDFMQQQGELLARRVRAADATTAEPTTVSRIQMAYRLIFGRAATEAEVRTGVQYLSSEPMTSYDERKAASEKEKDSKDGKKNATADADEDGKAKDETIGDGMMAGVIPGAAKKDDEKKLLPVTPWGRYMKILLSSSEFLFVS